MKHPHRKCPICNHDTVDPLHFQRFALPVGHPLSEGYEVVCCRNCGFVYADTNVSQETYDHFYARYSKYEDARTGTGGVENPWDIKRQKKTAKQISGHVKNPSLSILDVGCANGGLLKSLRDLGYVNLLGVDPSPVCIENTRKLGLDAEIGSLFQPIAREPFDCIILSHTLEHIQDLTGALEWINKRLKPEGTVYIETPDAVRYVDFIYSPFQDFNTEHINHFSLTCLGNFMQLHGFLMSHSGKKVLKVATDIYYPAIFGVWTKTDGHPPKLVKKDKFLRSKMEEYINRSKKMTIEIDAQISKILLRSPSIVVWGTGQLTMKLLAETSLTHGHIVAFVDNNPINHGKLLHDIPIVSPKELDKLSAPILVATLLHHKAIARQIHEMGLKNEIFFLNGE